MCEEIRVDHWGRRNERENERDEPRMCRTRKQRENAPNAVRVFIASNQIVLDGFVFYYLQNV